MDGESRNRFTTEEVLVGITQVPFRDREGFEVQCSGVQ